MNDHDNPCLTCPDICCSLKGDCGLRLTSSEYEKLFKNWETNLNVREQDGIVIISTKEGFHCPNLVDKGCGIYEERPIDCRLYPYQMIPAYVTKTRVKIMLYMQQNCVEDRSFRFPEAEARKLVEAFGKRAYGDKIISVCVFKDRFLPKMTNKLEVLTVKCLQSLGLL